jgi:8-oxo-dGTP diphosphatase
VKPTYRDHWSIPGGVIEVGESPRAGCEREVAEEIGLRVQLGALLAVDYTTPTTAAGRESLQFLFDGGVLDAEQMACIALPPAELSGHQFATPDEVRRLLNPRLARRLPSALAARHNRTDVYLEEGRAR